MNFELLILQITNVIHRSIQKFKQEIISGAYADMTLSHLYYVEAVYQLNRPTVSELSNHLMVSKASTSEAIKKLINRGLLIKSQSENDKRVYHVALSDTALKLMEAEKKAMEEFTDNIKNSLNDDEIRFLEDIFKRILRNYMKS